MSQPLLKLLAQDEQDVQVIAAVLQDAIAPVSEMAFRAEDKNFVMIVHRFRWDCVPSSPDGFVAPKSEEGCDCVFERIACALDVEGVESVQYQGFNQESPGTMLELLTIEVDGDFLQMIFAGGAKMRLKLANWRLKVVDFGESWPTTHRPRHAT